MIRTVAHATWDNWPHVGECYRVRTRGAPSAHSREGFVWTNTYGMAVPRPAPTVWFHGGPRDGQHDTREAFC